MTHLPTARTQIKIAELLHESCTANGLENVKHPVTSCSLADDWQLASAMFLGHLMPIISLEMFPAVREDAREKAAYRIEAELVCCDMYQRLETAWEECDPGWTPSQPTPVKIIDMMRPANGYHAICHYGGWAAHLARNTCPAGKRTCEPGYFCPTSGEYESPCHGGFDTCCSYPELHQQMIKEGEDGKLEG